jgi:hypothetical protein
MYLDIEDLKKKAPHAKSMEEFVQSLRQDEPTVIFRNYNEPATPPYLQSGVKIHEFKAEQKPSLSFGTKPNVPGINVYNALIKALGSGGYAINISDSSYTGYTIWELQNFLSRFDSTDLQVWIPEVFDCDDFSQVLEGTANLFFKGIPLGTLWYGAKDGSWGHSVNIFYSFEYDKLFLIEPQTDVFYEFDQKNWVPWVVML